MKTKAAKTDWQESKGGRQSNLTQKSQNEDFETEGVICVWRAIAICYPVEQKNIDASIKEGYWRHDIIRNVIYD